MVTIFNTPWAMPRLQKNEKLIQGMFFEQSLLRIESHKALKN